MKCDICGYDHKNLEEDYCINCKSPLSESLKIKEEKVKALIKNYMELKGYNYESYYRGWFATGRLRRSMNTDTFMASIDDLGYQIGALQQDGRDLTILVCEKSHFDSLQRQRDVRRSQLERLLVNEGNRPSRIEAVPLRLGRVEEER